MSTESHSEKTEGDRSKKMAVAVDVVRNNRRKSWQSGLKRGLDFRVQDELGVPLSKKMVTEEDMSRYLEQLRIVAREGDDQQQTPLLCSGLGDSLLVEDQGSPDHTCRHSPGSRKRRLDFEGEAMMDYDEDSSSDSTSESLWKPARDSAQFKRVRLDGISSLPVLENPSLTNQFHSSQESSHSLLLHCSSPTLVASCVGTQLSSIPERCGSGGERKNEDSAESNRDKQEEKDDDEETTLSGRVWLAPEVQRLCRDKSLPATVINEIKQRKMALVPYMGPKLLLDLPPQPNQIQNTASDRQERTNEDLDLFKMDS